MEAGSPGLRPSRAPGGVFAGHVRGAGHIIPFPLLASLNFLDQLIWARTLDWSNNQKYQKVKRLVDVGSFQVYCVWFEAHVQWRERVSQTV